MRDPAEGFGVASAQLLHAAAMGWTAQHPIGDAERVHDIEREQRDVRRLEHVAASVEHEIGLRLRLRGVGPRALAEPFQQFVLELQPREMVDVAGNAPEALDPLAPAYRDFILAGDLNPRHGQQEARIDPVVADLDALPARNARAGPGARGRGAVGAAQNVNDPGDDIARRVGDPGRVGDRTGLDTFAAARAGVEHGIDARGQSGFETLVHSALTVQRA